jgi:hypothetical protein
MAIGGWLTEHGLEADIVQLMGVEALQKEVEGVETPI